MSITPIPLRADWLEPDPYYLRPNIPPPPALLLADVLSEQLAEAVSGIAVSKGAPADYVFIGLLAVSASAIGNARWVTPWPGWAEPAVIWAMCIGPPSSGKSPAVEAAIAPLRNVEKALRQKAEAKHCAWSEKAAIAKMAEKVWMSEVRKALQEGEEPPPKPEAAKIDSEPPMPRLLVNSGTIERLGEIQAHQPKGFLQVRDELSGWLQDMSRYSQSSDRPFWLEAYGGRSFTVERMSRPAQTVDRLSISVLGGIQPDRLNSLLMKADDDGMLARLLPIWPDLPPVTRPADAIDKGLLDTIIERLVSCEMISDEDCDTRPVFVPFTEDARQQMEEFRVEVRNWELAEEGLMVSFLGKMPGLSARLALILAFLDWAVDGGAQPNEINVDHFGCAAHLIEDYFLPMARRSYAMGSASRVDMAARRLIHLIRERGWREFSSRYVLRMRLVGLEPAKDLDLALNVLEQADCIRPIESPSSDRGGRPQRRFKVNPFVLEGGA